MRFPSLTSQKIIFAEFELCTGPAEVCHKKKRASNGQKNINRLLGVIHLASVLAGSESTFAGYRTFFVNAQGEILSFGAVKSQGFEAIRQTASGDESDQLCIAAVRSTAALEANSWVQCEITGEILESPY
jgi:hypothetical protein